MRCRWLVLILLSLSVLTCQSFAQQAPASSSAAGNEAASPASEVAPDAAVITIDGVCKKDPAPDAKSSAPSQTATPAQPDVPPIPGPSAFDLPTAAAGSDGRCVTVITRAQFEKLTSALKPQMSPALKKQLATYYPQMLFSAQRIEELGLDKDPSFETKLGFGYLQVLHKSFTQYVQDNARNLSDADVEKYYKEHPETFEQVDLLRLLIPDAKRKASAATSDAGPVAPTVKLVAQRIYREALAGGKFETLQARAFKAVGDASDPPEVALGKVTRAEIPAEVRSMVFALRPGDVSKPTLGVEGLFIFKVRSKSVIPLSNAKGVIQRIRIKEAMDGLKNSIHSQLNEAYFGKPADSAKAGKAASK
jgi:hypothetical protein